MNALISLLVETFGSSLYSIISSMNADHFFLSILDAFYFLSCLIAVTKTFNTILNRSGDNGHPCLISDFRGKTLSFSLLSMMLLVTLL